MWCFSFGIDSVPRGYKIYALSNSKMHNLYITPVKYTDSDFGAINVDSGVHDVYISNVAVVDADIGLRIKR